MDNINRLQMFNITKTYPGIGRIFQHGYLFEPLSVHKNFEWVIDDQAGNAATLATRIRETSKIYGMPLDPDCRIASGEFHPFTGPIKNQAGEEMLATGAVMSDGELLGMNDHASGVEGKLE